VPKHKFSGILFAAKKPSFFKKTKTSNSKYQKIYASLLILTISGFLVPKQSLGTRVKKRVLYDTNVVLDFRCIVTTGHYNL